MTGSVDIACILPFLLPGVVHDLANQFPNLFFDLRQRRVAFCSQVVVLSYPAIYDTLLPAEASCICQAVQDGV